MIRIKNLRLLFNFTQKELADKLNIRQNTYCQYENGQRQPSIEILIKLSEIFDTSIDYLVGITDEEQPYPKKN